MFTNSGDLVSPSSRQEIMAMGFSKILVIIYEVKAHHYTEDHNLIS
jgi:hypothetical protein